MRFPTYGQQHVLDGCHIMILENDGIFADDLAFSVTMAGAIVRGLYVHPSDALAAIKHGEIDLAILDVNLRGWGAFPVAEALRARRTPFVFVTEYDITIIPDRWGEVPLWERPFDPSVLVASLPQSVANFPCRRFVSHAGRVC